MTGWVEEHRQRLAEDRALEEGYQRLYSQAARDCHCCGVCSPVVCDAVLVGGLCEEICRCDDTEPDKAQSMDDFDAEGEHP